MPRAATSPRDYHLAELHAATTPGHPSRILPDVPSNCRSVLDVGCGAGQTLIALDLPPHIAQYGLDVDEDALRIGRTLTQKVAFLAADGAHLPVRDASIDLLLCRVALPYLDVRQALADMHRVLAPGGTLWLVLHPLRMTLDDLASELRSAHVKGVLYRLYVLANGLSLHLGGPQLRFPLNRSRNETFQTERSLRRLLTRLGFAQIEATRTRHFVMTAVKPR